MFTIEELKVIEKFESAVRRRELERTALRAPSGKKTLYMSGERLGPLRTEDPWKTRTSCTS